MVLRFKKFATVVQLEIVGARCTCGWSGLRTAAPDKGLSVEAAKFVLIAEHTKKTRNCPGNLNFCWGPPEM